MYNRPTAPFIKNEKGRSFLEKYLLTVSNSGLKIDHL